jgi:predicted CXXCH cytochrome family protein
LAGGISTGLLYCSHPVPHASLASAGYVDPNRCAECHSNIWETYRHTGMGRSFHRPQSDETSGSERKAAKFYHKASDSYFSMVEHDGRLYLRRYQIGFDGKETNIIEKSADYVIGSGNHARTYLHRTTRNTLVELPLAWYAEQGGYWAMNPGYDRPDHPGFRRGVTYACMFCHNAIPENPPGAAQPAPEAVFGERIPEGIDCQRCHGPGGKHVLAAQNPRLSVKDVRNAIVNPARLGGEREMEVCMQCHLETTSFRLPNAIVRYERGPFSYIPGEPLQDFMLHFDRAGGSDRFEIVSAAYRLRRSACFLQSRGALRCTTCHNPHENAKSEAAAVHYVRVCRQCHSASLDQLAPSGKHPVSGDCVGCHMPKRRTEDVVHVVMTDHFIQRRKPERDLLEPIAERHETDANAYQGEVVPYYPQDLDKGTGTELYRAIAQVSQKSNLRQGVPELAEAIAKYRPGRIEYNLHLGDALVDSGQLEKALQVYEEAAKRNPDSFAALRKLGSALRSSGQTARSAEVLKRALAVGPGDAATWHELGLDYLNLGTKTEAVTAFQRAVDLDPDIAEAYNSLGGVSLEGGDLAGAEKAFRESIRVQPDYAEAHSNLGYALSSSGRFEEARYHFQAAIRLKPDYAAARFNYAIALARVRRFDEAQHQIEEELKVYPTAAEAHDLLGNLLLAKGKLAAALDQYREAVRIRPEFGRAQLDLGEALADSGDTSAALPYLEKAAASQEQSVRQEASQTLVQLRGAH